MKSHRRARVSEVIREVTSETVLFQIKDPRVKGVTVTRAEVSGDLQHAKVYVSVMGSQRDQVMCLRGLQQAAGFVQSRLADRMKSRFVPIITFVEDVGVKNSIEVNRLIREALALDPPAEGTEPEAVAVDPEDEEEFEDDDEEEVGPDLDGDEDEDDEEDDDELNDEATAREAERVVEGKADAKATDSSEPKAS